MSMNIFKVLGKKSPTQSKSQNIENSLRSEILQYAIQKYQIGCAIITLIQMMKPLS